MEVKCKTILVVISLSALLSVAHGLLTPKEEYSIEDVTRVSMKGGGDAQNVDVDLGHFLDVDCRLKGFKKCRIYKEFFEK